MKKVEPMKTIIIEYLEVNLAYLQRPAVKLVSFLDPP
jgi:hypothetical protein